MVWVLDFVASCDNDRIDAAIAARTEDGIVVLQPKENREPWLLDRAICLPENTTILLCDCVLKLSDRCRDNIFRSANCGLGISDPEQIRNIHIIGQPGAVLRGADHPRATGDGGKLLANPCPHRVEDLCVDGYWIPEDRRNPEGITFDDCHDHTYGTDFGVEGESQYGVWRNIGVLLANVENFSVCNLKISDPHGWSISLEACTHGRICNITFDACMSKMIDGMCVNMENQDGVDIRNGCSDITISDITGTTGDDVVALTAIASKIYRPGGSLRSTHVMHNDWSRRDRNIHDITITNVRATSYLCWLVRLLAAETEIYNVVIDGVTDTATAPGHFGGVLIGEGDAGYGKNLPDCVRNVSISNVIANGAEHAVGIRGYLTDSTICNVINKNPCCEAIQITRDNALKNVCVANVVSAGQG